MQITTFNINPNRTAINLTIVDAAGVNSLNLWTDKTYKNYNSVIDLSSKLNGSNIQDITIQLSDLNISYFDGIYFIEAESNDDISSSITADLTRYEECILNKVLEISICDDCLTKKSDATINSHVLLTSLQDAIEQGFTDEIFTLVKALNKYCSNECKSCGGYKNQPSGNYYSLPAKNINSSENLALFLVSGGNENNNGVLFEILDGSTLIYSRLLADTDTSLESVELELNKPYIFKTTHDNFGNSNDVVSVFLLNSCTMEYHYLISGSAVQPSPIITDTTYNSIMGCEGPGYPPYPTILFGSLPS